MSRYRRAMAHSYQHVARVIHHCPSLECQSAAKAIVAHMESGRMEIKGKKSLLPDSLTFARRAIVRGLEIGCTLTHPITLHNPWLLFFSNCPLATLSFKLAERWDLPE